MQGNHQAIFDDAFDQRIKALMDEWQIPGAAIVFVKDGEAPSYRTLSQAGYSPIKLNTRFPIASCTKLVAALLLGKALREAGKDLTTRVKDVLPEFELVDPDATEECTIEDLIAHRCRIPSYDVLFFRPLEKGEDLMSRLKYLPRTGKLREEPHRYNNQVQQIVYTIIERLSGKSFEACMRETIFDPLGMDYTGFSAAEANEDFAPGYRAVHTPTGMREDLTPVVYGLDNLGEQMGMAAGRIISTVEDLGKLLEYLPQDPLWPVLSLRPGNFAQSVAKGNIAGQEALGIGSISISMAGYQMIGHSGAVSGYRSHLMRIPDLCCGIAVLTNSTEGLDLAYCVEAWVIGRLTGDESLVDKVYNEVLQFRQQFYKDVTEGSYPVVGDNTLGKLIGTYKSPAFGTWEFDDTSNLPVRPFANITTIPWLPLVHGKTRPVVTAIKPGRYAGCLEWFPWEDVPETKGPLYGFPFELEVKGDEIHVKGLTGGNLACRQMDPAAVFRRVF